MAKMLCVLYGDPVDGDPPSYPINAARAAGPCEILECHSDGRPIREEYLIVDDGGLAGAGAQSYSAGNATVGVGESPRR